jgi:hypothetical protein
MNEQHFSLEEIIGVTLYLGSINFLIGIAYQLFISINSDRGINIKQLFLIVVTRISSISLTLIIWVNWTMKIDIQFGPFLLPALLAELTLSPIFLKLFGYSTWLRRKACP